MKFLIAGLGSIGRRHFRNLIALGETDLVLLRTRKATLPDDELAGYPVETDIHEALQKHKPDAVVVANPTSLHLDVAIPAAEAGCHILLEKPVSHSLDGLNSLQKAAEKSGSKILVGFQFRYHPTLNKARDIIKSGALGQVLTVHAHWGEYLPNWHPWEDYHQSYAARADLGGGVIGTLTHPLDYLRYLLGRDRYALVVQRPYFPARNGRGRHRRDWPEIRQRRDWWPACQLHPAPAGASTGNRRDEWNPALGQCRRHATLLPDACSLRFVLGCSACSRYGIVFSLPEGFDRNDLFLAQTRHFINIARGQEEPVCTLEDGIRIQKLVQAARESEAEGSLIRMA